MATRVLNRRVMRAANDQAETADQAPAEAKVKKTRSRKTTAEKPAKVKAAPKPRKRAVKAPTRTCARWAVCDNGLKRVAVFEYKDRAGADARLAEMQERKPGAYVLLLVKDPYDPPAEPAAAV